MNNFLFILILFLCFFVPVLVIIIGYANTKKPINQDKIILPSNNEYDFESTLNTTQKKPKAVVSSNIINNRKLPEGGKEDTKYPEYKTPENRLESSTETIIPDTSFGVFGGGVFGGNSAADSDYNTSSDTICFEGFGSSDFGTSSDTSFDGFGGDFGGSGAGADYSSNE